MLRNSASGNFNLAVVVVVVVVVVAVTRPLPRDGSMVEDHGTQKSDNSPGLGPEVVERQKIAKERAAQKVRGWTVQNEMRGVLGRVFRTRCAKDSQFCQT